MIYPDHAPDDHVCVLCPRPRDWQRARVYRAEQAAIEAVGRGTEYRDLRSMERVANAVIGSDWWLSRFRYAHPVSVQQSKRGDDDLVISFAEPASGVLAFHRDMRDAVHLSHEMAHVAQPWRSSWHGPEFAACYIAICRHIAGPTYSGALEAAFKDHGVKAAPLGDLL